MYIDLRLWIFTKTVRDRIFWAFFVGLISAAVGVARLALRGVMVRASLAVAAVLSLWFTVPTRAAEPVDLALVLAVDSSSSVDYYEFKLQMDGLADAFRDGAVLNAIKAAAPNGIAVTLVQWSSSDRQALAFGWTEVRDAASAEAVARMIDLTPRLVGGWLAVSVIDSCLGDIALCHKARSSHCTTTWDHNGGIKVRFTYICLVWKTITLL